VGAGLHASPLIATLEAKAYAINDAGSVVGYYTEAGTGFYIPFLYNGGFTVIGSKAQAIGINNANEVVGYYFDGKPHGFLYKNGVRTTIDYPLIGSRGTVAQGINDSGQIAGIYFDASDRDRGFVKTGASYVTIDYPGSIFSGLTGINNAGQVAGYYQDASGSHGFLAIPAPDLPGDFNYDGAVDGADYVVWRNNPHGIYTQNDYDVWRAHFGQTVARAGATAGPSGTTVPEPMSVITILLALAGLVVIPRHRGMAKKIVAEIGRRIC
jgi:hypothetical protein